MNRKKILIILGIILAILLLSKIFLNKFDQNGASIGNSQQLKVKIAKTLVNVEIADKPDLWYKGLSNHNPICSKCGMLFIFPDKAERTFVMREMRFPLDIIWIDEDKVVKIDKNLPPEGSFPENNYASLAPVNYVLEVNAGLTEKENIKVGDKFSH